MGTAAPSQNQMELRQNTAVVHGAALFYDELLVCASNGAGEEQAPVFARRSLTSRHRTSASRAC